MLRTSSWYRARVTLEPTPTRDEDPNAAANKMFVQAQKMIEEASAQDSEEKLITLNHVQEIIKKLIKDYSSSNLAVQLSAGQNVGNFTKASLDAEIKKASAEATIVRAKREQASCVSTPTHDCVIRQALATAYSFKDDYLRASALASIAEAQARAGQAAAATDTFKLAMQLAGAIKHDFQRAAALALIAARLGK